MRHQPTLRVQRLAQQIVTELSHAVMKVAREFLTCESGSARNDTQRKNWPHFERRSRNSRDCETEGHGAVDLGANLSLNVTIPAPMVARFGRRLATARSFCRGAGILYRCYEPNRRRCIKLTGNCELHQTLRPVLMQVQDHARQRNPAREARSRFATTLMLRSSQSLHQPCELSKG